MKTAFLFSAIVLVVAACSKPAPPPDAAPVEVTVVTIAPQDAANVVVLPGRVQVVRTAEVRARVDGVVQKLAGLTNSWTRRNCSEAADFHRGRRHRIASVAATGRHSSPRCAATCSCRSPDRVSVRFVET
jgi:hypothetical protein